MTDDLKLIDLDAERTKLNGSAVEALRELGATDAQVWERPGLSRRPRGSDYAVGTLNGRRVLVYASGGMTLLWSAKVWTRYPSGPRFAERHGAWCPTSAVLGLRNRGSGLFRGVVL